MEIPLLSKLATAWPALVILALIVFALLRLVSKIHSSNASELDERIDLIEKIHREDVIALDARLDRNGEAINELRMMQRIMPMVPTPELGVPVAITHEASRRLSPPKPPQPAKLPSILDKKE